MTRRALANRLSQRETSMTRALAIDALGNVEESGGASQANGLGSAKAPEPCGLGPSGAIPSAFTPGPWKAHPYLGEEQNNWFVRGPNEERICGQGSGRIAPANALLIAAAPDLLEALEKIANGQHPTDTIEGRNAEGKFGPIPRYMGAAELQGIAIAALAKARGDTQ